MSFILTSLGPLVDRLTMIFDERHDFLDDYVVVQAGDTDHYVQFALFNDVIYAEAVADYYLTRNGAAPLTRTQSETLERLGWSAPSECNAETGSRHNFFREWSYDTQTQTLVTDVWRTVTWSTWGAKVKASRSTGAVSSPTKRPPGRVVHRTVCSTSAHPGQRSCSEGRTWSRPRRYRRAARAMI